MTRGLNLFLFLTLLVFSTGCLSGFDESTGVYKGKGVTATFPTGWESFSGVPNAVVARQDPGSSAKIFLSIEDAPGFSWEQYDQGRRANFRRMGMTEVDSGNFQVDGVTAHWAMIDQTMQGQQFRSVSYSFHANEKLYNLTGLASASEFGSWKDRFTRVADSFKFD